MLPKNNIKVVAECFFNEPNRKFHIRELVRITCLSTTAIASAINILIREGIVKRNKTAVIHEITADIINKKFKVAKRLHNLEAVYASGLVEYLSEVYGFPEAIVLFGSYSRGEDAEKSDIDIAIITKKKKQLNLYKFEIGLKRKIQLFEVDLKSIPRGLKCNICNGIILEGYIEW